MIDLVGIAGSALIVGSLMARSTCQLRVLGLVGAITYIAYGLLLGAWPVVATNTVTLSIHGFHLSTILVEWTRSNERARVAATVDVERTSRRCPLRRCPAALSGADRPDRHRRR